MTRSICEELLEELRELRADVHPDGFVEALTLDELAAIITKRERAAAERMRERCRLAMLDAHVTAMAENAPDEVVRATGYAIDAIDELEPEEPSECK